MGKTELLWKYSSLLIAWSSWRSYHYYDQMDSLSLALFSFKSKHELPLSEKLFWLTIRNRGGAVVSFYTFRRSVSVMVMKFSPWFFWSVYSSCSTIPQHVWMRIWHKISLMFWVSLNACSNVFFCLFTRRVLDLKAINQTLFHTLNMSPAFPAEEVRASWFQVRRKQHFFFWPVWLVLPYPEKHNREVMGFSCVF